MLTYQDHSILSFGAKLAMTFPFFPRTLLQTSEGKTTEWQYSSLDPKGGPIVVLGEAGMGKSRLLEQLGEDEGWRVICAKDLQWEPDDFKPDLLLIDALDEYPASTLSEALTYVLKWLNNHGRPPFILTCRASDWSEAELAPIIKAAYASPSRQFRLASLKKAQSEEFLQSALPQPKVSELLDHIQLHGLNSWLGNPQTLKLIIESVRTQALPSSRSELFDQASRQLAQEHNDTKVKQQLAPQTAIALAGAVFATLVLTGKTAISRRASGNLNRDDLSITELSLLPGGEYLERLLDTRLFTAIDVDRFQYAHRNIAEYLAASWLREVACNARQRRRLLAMFDHQGGVPSNLRAVHAWLAKHPKLAPTVIRKDPIGLIEHGDIAALDVGDAAELLRALKDVHAENPEALSYWRPQVARGLIRRDLMDELFQLVTDPDQPTHFRIFILEALTSPSLSEQFKQSLSHLVLDDTQAYGVRYAAAAALAPLLTATQCTRHIRANALTVGDDDSIRIALDLCCLTAFAHVNDEVTAELISACTDQPERFGEWENVFSRIQTCLPMARRAGVLSSLARRPRLEHSSSCETAELCDQHLYAFVTTLALETLTQMPVSAATLWQWFLYLYSLRCVQMDSDLQQHLYDNVACRQALQRHVLFENDDARPLLEKSQQLGDIAFRLDCSEQDAIALLEYLCPHDIDDDRWKDIVLLSYHVGDWGSALRLAARPFAAASLERSHWLEALERQATQRLAEQVCKRVEAQQKDERTADQAAQVIKRHVDAIDQVRLGNAEYLLVPALIYVERSGYAQIGDSGYERLVNWGGEALAIAVINGLDTYLNTITLASPLEAFASHLAELLHGATPRKHEFTGISQHIVLAAVSQRASIQTTFSELADGPLLAAFLSNSNVSNRASRQLGVLIDDALAQRGLLKEALRLCIEPILTVEGAWLDLQPSHSERYEEKCKLIAELARDWLYEHKDMPGKHQLSLFNHIWSWDASQIPPLLAQYAGGHLGPRPAFLDAAQLVKNFAQTSIDLDRATVKKDLLVNLMELHHPPMSIEVATWVFAQFRVLYPMTRWVKSDAIDPRMFHSAETLYLHGIIAQLVNSPSPAATDAINRLCACPPDSYTNALRTAQANKMRKMNERDYLAPTLDDIIAVTQDLAPRNEVDLRAYVLEQLDEAQRKINNDQLNSWSLFYHNDRLTPCGEDECRNRLVGLLLQAGCSVEFTCEYNVVNKKRVDFMCKSADISLPVEVKLAWNPTLWTAAEKQLDALYTPYHSSGRRGIYLVLWFGPLGKQIPGPKDGGAIPDSPERLKEMLIERSSGAREGRIEVVVLDLSR